MSHFLYSIQLEKFIQSIFFLNVFHPWSSTSLCIKIGCSCEDNVFHVFFLLTGFFFSRVFPSFVTTRRIWKRTRCDGSDSRPSPNKRRFFYLTSLHFENCTPGGKLNVVLLFWEFENLKIKSRSNFVRRLYQNYQNGGDSIDARVFDVGVRGVVGPWYRYKLNVDGRWKFTGTEYFFLSIEHASVSTDPVHTSGGCHYSDGIPDVSKGKLCSWNIWDD